MSGKGWSLVWLLAVVCTVSVIGLGCSGADAPKAPKKGASSGGKT